MAMRTDVSDDFGAKSADGGTLRHVSVHQYPSSAKNAYPTCMFQSIAICTPRFEHASHWDVTVSVRVVTRSAHIIIAIVEE